jgi:hypothetical protein
MEDLRGSGAPADIGLYELPVSAIVYLHTFSGTTYVCAAQQGDRGWILIGHLPHTGVNATTVINAALALGGKVFVAKATYNGITMLTVNQSDMVFECEAGTVFNVDDTGIASVAYTGNFANPAGASALTGVPVVLVGASITNVVLRGFKINDTGANRGFHRIGVLIWKSTEVLVEKVNVQHMAGSAYAVHSDGTYDLTTPEISTFTSSEITFRKCKLSDTRTFANAKGFGFNISFALNVLVVDCEASDTEESTFRTHGSTHVVFNHCTETAHAVGSAGEGVDVYRSDDVTFRNGYLNSPLYSAGFYIYEYCRNIKVLHTHMLNLGSSQQIRIQGSAGFLAVTMDNILIQGCTLNAMIFIDKTDECTICECRFNLDGTLASYALKTHTVTGGSIIFFHHNKVYHSGEQGVWIQTPVATINVLIVIEDNFFFHCCDRGAGRYVINFAATASTISIIARNKFLQTQNTRTISIGANVARIYQNEVDQTISATASWIINNPGYNPRGNIATPWANAATGDLSDVAGALDNPVSDALYTVTMSPKLIILTNCTGVTAVQIDGVTLTNMTTQTQMYKLHPGQTIHVVWATTTPHGEVFAE